MIKFDHTHAFPGLPGAHMDRWFVGGDRVMKKLADIADQTTKTLSKYPPYNIKKIDEDRYVIEVAVAGFGRGEIDLTIKDSRLKVSGKVSSPTPEENFLFKGIAERDFTHEFHLAENVEVKSADLVNGMLKIWLDALTPQSEKEIKININDETNVKSKAEFLTEEDYIK